ncbi:TonB-dependent receptor plug domain-containing protein [Phenylobacterium koreense]|uniref:Outer membrane receptor protein involved in Fe transport n=1 Tax=Phenylobacterium koreense TaxID=266125 RepID=A0ABV2EJJ3_9CAUL
MIVPALASALALAAPPAPTAGASAAGVISYPPGFFAAAQPANAEEMLLRLPGFNLDLGEDVRGFEGAAGNVLIDGQRPATKTDSLEEILRRIPASQVARIDLIRGGAPGVDMQGKAILANVVRKPGAGFRGLAALSARSVYDGRGNLSGRIELSGGANDRTWDASAVVGSGVDDGAGEGPEVRLGPDGASLRLSDVDSEGDTLQEILTASYSAPLLGGRAKVNGRLFNDNFKFDESNTITFPSPAFETTILHQDEFQTELGGNFLRDFGPKTSLELVAIRQDAQIDITEDFAAAAGKAAFALDRRTSESIGRGVIKHRPSDRLSFELGGEAALNVLKSRTSYAEDDVPVDLPAANVRVEERRGEAFVKATWRANPKWTFEGGLRYEASAIESSGDVGLEKTLYYAKPRLAVTWATTRSTQLRFRFERVVDQLDFDDFVADSSLNTGVVTAGNPDLVPEQAWVAEAAIEQRFPGGAVVVVTARRSLIDDVIDRAPVFLPTGVFDAPSNIGDGTKDELLLTATLPFDPVGLRGVTLRGQATWRHSETTDPTTGEEREISGLRPVEWEAHLTHDLPAYRFNWGVDVFGGWRETYYRFNEISTDKLKTYVVPFAEWKPRRDIVLRAEIQNVTSRGFRHTRVVYDGPRDTSPVAFINDRDIQVGPMYWFRIRKTFGS